MALTDEQIGKLLEWFINESHFHKKWSEVRKRGQEENHKWLQPSVLQKMSDQELRDRFIEYYKSGSGEKQSLNQIYRDRIVRDMPSFRKALMYLLDESIPIEDRITEVLEGKYRLEGFGRAIVTALLMDFQPDKYCLWNNKTDTGFSALGWQLYERGDSQAIRYLKVLDALKKLRAMRPDLDLSLLDVDAFLHTIAAEKEGKNKVKELINTSEDQVKYWQIAPGEKARLWKEFLKESIAAVGWNELNLDLKGKSKEELVELCRGLYGDEREAKAKVNATQLHHFLSLKPGDRIVTNLGKQALLALGIVKSDYKFRPERKEYRHTVDVDYYNVSDAGIPIPDFLRGKFGKTITPLTKDEYRSLEKLFPSKPPIYTLENFSHDTGFSEQEISQWQRILLRKKHVIFQGPPGTGKTFVAQKLAKLLVSGTRGLVEIVQFHPAYAYEDFVQGIRPEIIDGQLSYMLMPGRFLEFCHRSAELGKDAPCVMIIDEINRANLARVFGELMFLLEYRDQEIPLSAGGEPFRIPENVYLIGTMNTADRSIALVDHALRRRFSFIRLRPNYEVLRVHLESRGYSPESLIRVLKEINKAIGDSNYEIGISFFIRNDDRLKEHLPDIWMGEIEPYLEEFFYDQPGKVEPFRWGNLIENKLKEWV